MAGNNPRFCYIFFPKSSNSKKSTSKTDLAETYLPRGPTTRIEESKMVSIRVAANPDGSASIQLPV
ncbi:MAG: hypothetical protein ABSE06_14095 [Anaerolineaceae bacterium]|jgi:hypothetical protein